jgi:oligopeptide transport system permease protein
MPEQARAVLMAKYGLDKPVVERYFIYMKNLLATGDFGESIIYTGRSANTVIRENAPISMQIGGVALVLQLSVGVGLGLIAALKRNKPTDHIIRVCVVLAICVPSFVFCSLLQYYFAFTWQLAPVFGWGEAKHFILPVLACVLGGTASYAKYTRNGTLTVMSEDYIITAKAKGCDRGRIIRKHVLRNAMIPIVTMIGPAVAGIFAGSFILERMFAIPGLGAYYVKSVSDNDYTMILGLTIFYAVLDVASLLGVDILYGLVDPRIRLTRAKG